MKSKNVQLLFFYLIFFVSSCVEPFEPPVIKDANNFLVVEGNLNVNGTSQVLLTRSSDLSGSLFPQSEISAQVSVVGNNQEQFLASEGTGWYSADLDLSPQALYYLSIKTEDGKEYRSEDLQIKMTPEIDDITWEVLEGDQLQLFISTHDTENKTWYYRWEFIETWEYNAPLRSFLEYSGGMLQSRPPENQIYTCWESDHSTSILLGSSAKLSEDIIHQKPIATVPFLFRLSKKYSVLVKQYALTQEAYQYLENMKKNSEDRGSFFDSQPTEIRGNIYSISNPNEPVIGYISASTVEEKRIYITSRDVDYFEFFDKCKEMRFSQSENVGELGLIPLSIDPFGRLIATDPFCGDCRNSGGTTEKPHFWE